MKSIFTILFIAMSCYVVHAQNIADFENFNLPIDSFLNGSQGNEEFISGDIQLKNDYNPDWGSWSHWSISSKTDVVTPDYTNDLSVISGAGFESDTYAVAFGDTKIYAAGTDFTPEGVYLNNSTYAYYTIKNGNQFSKKFGGAEGTDPDYFVVHFVGFDSGEAKDTVDFYLADFRGEDDYIIDEWTWVDFTSMGTVDSIGVSFESTDVGDFGINTPLYFCMDNFKTKLSSETKDLDIEVSVYPNPTTEKIWLKTFLEVKKVSIFNENGQPQNSIYNDGSVDLRHLPSGIYSIVIETPSGTSIKRVVKL